MTDLRKAAEQALRMLVDVEQYIRVRRIHPIIADDMAECAEILRAALAEPDEVAAAVEAERAAILAACDMIWAAGGGYQRPAQLTQLMNWIRARSKP